MGDQVVIPVMDGFDKRIVSSLSSPVQIAHQMQEAGIKSSVENVENVIGDVFYADSRYAMFTQIADVASYLRQVYDRKREGLPLTAFKQQLLSVGRRLDPAIIREDIISMNPNGRAQLPPHRR